MIGTMTTIVQKVQIRPFHPKDQTTVQALILEGLVEHWGFLDPTLNPDLNDIQQSYALGTFLVAEHEDELIGTGALMPEGDNCGRIVRMSVASQRRRLGIGRLMLDALLEAAANVGYNQAVLETTSNWNDAISFYLNYGFEIVVEQDGDFHFVMPVPTSSS